MPFLLTLTWKNTLKYVTSIHKEKAINKNVIGQAGYILQDNKTWIVTKLAFYIFS